VYTEGIGPSHSGRSGLEDVWYRFLEIFLNATVHPMSESEAREAVAMLPKGERALEALEALEVEIDQLAMAVFLL
jgi:hypothetical protein